MRKLSILKTLLDLAFFFSAFTILAVVIFLPMIVLGYADDLPIKLNGQEVIAFDWPTKLLLIFGGISCLLFFYSIFLLRKTIYYFYQRDLFNEKVILHFNTIGKCLVASSLVVSVPLFFYNVLHKSKLGVSFDMGFQSPLLAVSLGLFFMVLSEVFRIAKSLKEENDLTL